MKTKYNSFLVASLAAFAAFALSSPAFAVTFTYSGAQITMNQAQAPVATYDTINFNITTGYFGTSGAKSQTYANPNIIVTGMAMNNGWGEAITTFSSATTFTGSGAISLITAGLAQDFVFAGNMTGYTGNISMAASGNATLTLGNTGSNIVQFGGTTAGGTTALGTVTGTSPNRSIDNVSGTGTFSGNNLVFNYAADAAYDYLRVTNSTIAVGKSIAFIGSANIESNSIISGAGELVKQGAGIVTLSGANVYTGATTISAGTVKAGVASVAGVSGAFGKSSAVTIADSASTNIDLNGFDTQIGSLTGGGALGGNVVLGANTLTIGGNNTSPAAYAGEISGIGGAITKSGSGILTLSGISNYTGATSVNAGTLSVTGSQTGSAVAVANLATLGGTGTVGATTVASGGLLAPGVAGTGTLTTGNLSFSGTGTITLGTFSNYTAAPAIAAGTLTASGAAGSVTINLGGATATNGTYQLLSYTGGSIGGTGTSAFVIGTKPTIGARQSQNLVDTGSALNWVVVGANPYWTGLTSTEWSTATISGSKNWKLEGDDSPTDYLTGDIVLFNDSANDAAPIVNISVADVVPTGMTFSNVTKDYTINGGFGITTGNLSKSGAGGLAINTANSFGGGTTLTEGTITLGTATALGSGGVALNGGTLDLGGQTIGNALTAGAGILGGTGGTVNGGVSGTTLKVNTADTVMLTNAANSYTGTTTITAGTLQIGGAGTLGSGTYAGAIANSGIFRYSSSAAQSLSGGISGVGSVVKDTGVGTLTLSVQNTYSGGTTVNAGILNLTGGGGFSGTIRGTATVNTNGTLRLSTQDATGYGTDASRLSIINLVGGTLNVNTTGNQTLGSAVINMTGGSITGIAGSNLDFFANGSAINTLASANESTISLPTINLRQDNTIFDIADGDATNDLVISSVIGNGAQGNHAMIKNGAGTMRLTGLNVFAGNVTVNNGLLDLTAGGLYTSAYNSANIVTVNTGGTLLLNSFGYSGTASLGQLRDYGTARVINGGTIEVTAGTASVGNNFNVGVNGGTFLYNPTTTTDTLTLSGNANSNISIVGALTLKADGNISVGEVIEGVGSIAKTGAKTLTLSTTNTYSGTTTVTEGTLAVTGALGATAVTVQSGATLGGNGNIGGAVTIENGGHHALAVAATTGAQATRTITGALDLSAATDILDLTAAAPPAAGVYILATATGGITGAPGTVNQSGVSGTFAVNGNNLELTVAAGYSSWALANAGGGAFNADFDNDGMSNGLEYFMGETGSTFTPNPQPVGGIVSYPRDPTTTGVSYKVKTSPDLSVWTDKTADADISDPNFVKYTLPTGEGKIFLRLEVTQN